MFTGAWESSGRGELTVVNPATGEALAAVADCGGDEVARSARAAAEAQGAWAARPAAERAAVLRRAGDLWRSHADEVARWLVAEAGSVPAKGAFEAAFAADECFEAAALATRPPGTLLDSALPRLSYARRVPAGVVGVIAPFNFPLVLAVRAVAPALALGNAVLLKPDPRTPVSGGVALARVFEEAGLPRGVLHVLPGGAEAGRAVTADPRVRVVAFTGSPAAGRAVGEEAARSMKRAHLELGGNSAVVVLDDADLDAAVAAAAWGSFFHQGQICMATGRHLVHERVAEEYVARLAERARSLVVGDPMKEDVDLGPLIDAGQRDKVHALVRDSVAGGARLVTGGTYDGLYYRPTVLTGVTDDSPAYREEVFGPVAPVRSFATFEEAVSLARDSRYGLSLGVFTRDVMKGLDLADRVPTGLVHINDQTVDDEAVAPFGGLAGSGNGARLGGEANLDAFTETRWITVAGAAPPRAFR
ncbi:aldehyde dehydrogenase family protein [Streptomyces sp. TR1341]|uniref:aldehyde dehydrogenase family protein n=1 Tax=Streptomyces sp. TR1341 TaxID=2601266 RepID=UPI00138AE030|nr:aldehyde dehydrogenase family protein [Streptomyces sp. TR1341]